MKVHAPVKIVTKQYAEGENSGFSLPEKGETAGGGSVTEG